jgi:hypothetical protein
MEGNTDQAVDYLTIVVKSATSAYYLKVESNTYTVSGSIAL